MNFSTQDIAKLYDAVHNETIDTSLEAIVSNTNFEITSNEAYLQLKSGYMSAGIQVSSNTEFHHHVPSFVGKDSEKEQTIIIDDTLFFAVLFNDDKIISQFIRQISNIPKESIINVVIELSSDQIDYPTIDSATFIMNMLRSSQSKKVFNFGTCIGFIELMIASCCDDIYVSDFAAVSLIRRIDSNRIPRFIYPLFKQFARFTFQYWVSKGLFSVEEIADFGESEAKGSINLLADEIKERLGKLTGVSW